MAKLVYAAVLSRTIDQSDGSVVFSLFFPDLDGCFSQGSTADEAFLNGKEALALYYSYHLGDISNPSSLTAIQEKYPNKTILLVDIDSEDYPQKTKVLIKKNLSIPEWLCRLADKYELNYSATLKSALIHQLLQSNKITDYERRMLK